MAAHGADSDRCAFILARSRASLENYDHSAHNCRDISGRMHIRLLRCFASRFKPVTPDPLNNLSPISQTIYSLETTFCFTWNSPPYLLLPRNYLFPHHQHILNMSHLSCPSRTPFLPKHPPDLPATPNFSVGVELDREDLGDNTTVPASCKSPIFVRGIMHRPVCARSFVARVQYNATTATIARAFDVSEDFVERLWLAGVRSPAKQLFSKRALESKHARMKFTPQSVLDSDSISASIDPDNNPTVSAQNSAGLDRGQFADLFADDDDGIAPQCLEFANALIAKLEALSGVVSPDHEQQPLPRYRPTQRRPCMRMKPDAPPSNDCSSEGVPASIDSIVASSGSSSASSSSCSSALRCGFSETRSHPDLNILCDGFAICKVAAGLYRTARSNSVIRPPQGLIPSEKHYYFEVVIVQDENAGGVCVGVTSDALGLNKLVGSNHESVGLHSSGQIVHKGGDFCDFGKAYKSGDRVGCEVCVRSSCAGQIADPHVSAHDSLDSFSPDGSNVSTFEDREDEVCLTYYINGEYQGSIQEPLWRGVPHHRRKLSPAISLYKKGSKAVIQCCRKDWVGDKEMLCHNGNEVEAVCAGHS